MTADAWQANSKRDAKLHNIFENINLVFAALLLITGLIFIIASIVIGVTSNSDYETIQRLDTFMVASIVFMLIFLIGQQPPLANKSKTTVVLLLMILHSE